MVRLLKYEFYKLLHNRLLLIAIPALVIIFVLITRYKAPVADIYTRLIIILSNPVPAMWFVVVLAPFFVCDGYRSRTFNAAIYQGIGRVKTAVSRILVFYIYIAVITFLSVFAGLLYSSRILPDFSFVLPRIGLLLLLNIATAGLPLLVVFCFRDMFISLSVAGSFTFMMQLFMRFASGNEVLRKILQFYPPFLQSDMRLWLALSSRQFPRALTVSLAYIFATTCISCLAFYMKDMK